MNILNIILILVVIWSLTLTFFICFLFFKLKRIIPLGSEKKDLISFLDRTEKGQIVNSKEIKQLSLDLKKFIDQSKLDIQKIGLVKYNPFSESGGDHSFSLTLLDGHKNGIIITSLHARERTRIYVKEVRSGQSEIGLSKDEKKSLSKALV